MANSEASGYPAINLRDISYKKTTRSTGIVSEWWKIGDGVNKIKISDIVIAGHNFTSGEIGIDWTQRTSSFGTSHILNIAHNKADLWVAVGSSGKLATSSGLVDWLTAASNFDDSARYIAIAKLTEDTFVIAYEDQADSNKGKVRVGQYIEGSITWLTAATEFEATFSADIAITALTTDTFVIAYRESSDGVAIVGRYSEGSVTWRTGKTVFLASSNGSISIARLNEDTFVLAYQGIDGLVGGARIGQYTFPTITWLTAEVTFNPGITQQVGVAHLISNIFVIVYRDNSNSGYGTARVGEYSGGTIVWKTSETVYHSAQTYPNEVVALSSSVFAVIYADQTTDYGAARIGEYSGGNITWKTSEKVFNVVETDYVNIDALSSTIFVITYRDVGGGNYTHMRVGEYTGTAINWKTSEKILVADSTGDNFILTLCDNIFVAVYRNSGAHAMIGEYVTSSRGGLDWIQRTSSFDTSSIYGIAHDGVDLWVIVGLEGKLATSTDGAIWVQRTSSFSTDPEYLIRDVVHNQSNLWIAVGNAGKLAISSNGIDWAQQTSSFGTSDILGIAYNGSNLWVAVGVSGKLATSPNGTDWTQQTSTFVVASILGVAHDQSGLWVAVGADGKLATSTNGTDWIKRTSSFGTTHIRKVAYNGSVWIAVGDDGKLATSSDGIAWVQRTSSLDVTGICGIAHNNSSMWVITGADGKLAVSFDSVYKLQGNDTDVWTSPAKEETLICSADIITKFFTAGEYYYWRLLVKDTSNPDMYIEIGRISSDEHLQMPAIEPGLTYPKKTTSVKEITVTGQVYGDKGIIFRKPGFAFPIIEDSERIQIDAMFDEVHNIKPIFLIVYENSLDVIPALYCTIDQDELPWKKAEDGLNWSVQIKFLEAF